MDAQREPENHRRIGKKPLAASSSDGPSHTSEPVPAAVPAAVAVVIPAHNEASRIALTVLTARQLPGVDLVVVVDDASTDSTSRVAEESGATVLRLAGRGGRTEALVQGIALVRGTTQVTVRGAAARHLLILGPDVERGAAEAVRLLEPVLAGTADLALAAPTSDSRAEGVASRTARRGIERSTGFVCTRPLAVEGCITSAALSAAMPLSGGAGAGTGLIIDLLRQGFRVVDVPVAWSHRAPQHGLHARLHELRAWREVRRALASR